MDARSLQVCARFDVLFIGEGSPSRNLSFNIEKQEILCFSCFFVLILFSDEILSHIYRAGDEDDKALDDVLQIGVNAKEGKTYEDYS